MALAVRPQWTEKLYRPSGGQDHLGLGSVSSDRILPKLAPGINVLTFHPRYWSFYTFVLDEFWRRDLPRTRRAFVEFYRPCEAIFAVGAQLCDQPEHEQYGRMRGVVGAQKASPYAAQDPEAFDPQFSYMDSDLGGYGLYYATTIAAMGLIAPALAGTNLSFDAPTPEGRIVAAGFRSAVADTSLLPRLLRRLRPGQFLTRWFATTSAGPVSASCRPTPPPTVSCSATSSCTPAPRRRPRPAGRPCGSCWMLPTRATAPPLMRTGSASCSTSAPTPTAPPTARASGIERTARRWRLYQAREYYAYALNRLWAYLCAWGLEASVGGSRPVPLANLWEHAEAALDFTRLADDFGIADPGFSATTPIVEVAAWAAEIANVAGTLDDGWDIQAPLHEHALYRWSRGSGPGPTTLPGMAVLLLLVAERLGSPTTAADHAMDWDLVTEGGVARLAMSRFFVQLRRRAMAHESIGELLGWLYRDYVIRQHQQVAVTKLPDDTYRFRREGDRLRFFQQHAEAFMNSSRFEALVHHRA